MSDWFQSYGFAEVFDGLVVGPYPLDEDDVEKLARLHTERVLNLTEDDEYRPGDRPRVERALAAAGIEERRVSLVDYGELPPDAIEAAVQCVIGWLDEGERTYLHCRAGWQRSAAVAAGVVALRTGLDIDEALAYVQARKPASDPLPHQLEDLGRWWRGRSGGHEMPEKDGQRETSEGRGTGQREPPEGRGTEPD